MRKKWTVVLTGVKDNGQAVRMHAMTNNDKLITFETKKRRVKR